MRCPNCKNFVLQKSGKLTKIRIKGPLVFNGDGTCKASCHWCGSPVTVPLSVNPGTPVNTEKFVVPCRG